MDTRVGTIKPNSVVAVVPTLGKSPLLGKCLQSLRRQDSPPLDIVVVHSGRAEAQVTADLADRVLSQEGELGFAEACNWAVRETDSEFVAFVNDDVLVSDGWLDELREIFASDPVIAAVQGLNLKYDQPEIVDGCGIAWNRFWRPVQIAEGVPFGQPPPHSQQVFGVSAAAAMYRRSALRRVAPGSDDAFDPALVSFYEDVELAIRLRVGGFKAVTTFDARALHRSGTTSATMTRQCRRLRSCNRLLTLALLSGRRFAIRAPVLLTRDALDIGAHALRGRTASVTDIFAGWLRAGRLLGHYRHGGPPFAPGSSFPFRTRRAAVWPDQWRS